MLSPKHALPPLKMLGRRERNPVVELLPATESVLASVTHWLLTHCRKGHFDHLDRAGRRWLRSPRIPVVCTPHDAGFLRDRGPNVQPLAANHDEPQPFPNGLIRTVPCTSGKGVVGLLMEHGSGYFIQMPGEPRLYLSGDTLFTPAVRRFVERHTPQVSLVPAGGARFDAGHEIIMGVEDVLAFARPAAGSWWPAISNRSATAR